MEVLFGCVRLRLAGGSLRISAKLLPWLECNLKEHRSQTVRIRQLDVCPANFRSVPRAQNLRRVLLSWLLALSCVALILSCATPSPNSVEVASTRVLSPLATGTARSAGAMPTPTTSPVLTSPAFPTPTARQVPTGLASPAPTASPVPTSFASPIRTEGTPVYSYCIVNIFPHDRGAFTEGLVYEEGVLYEGTGEYGRSTLRRVELETGRVLQLYALPPQYFGEGITIWGQKIIQLTWKNREGFVYDKIGLELFDLFRYSTEGWGITHDGTRLIMSDGTSTLYFWDPETLTEIGQVQVHDDHGPVVRLNELEYVRGQVYANVWLTDRIAIIDPQTGQVTGWADLTGLLHPDDYGHQVDVLNGIAYDAEGDRLFVTGKWWSRLFEIKLIESGEQDGQNLGCR